MALREPFGVDNDVWGLWSGGRRDCAGIGIAGLWGRIDWSNDGVRYVER